jgi:cell division protein FtsL
MLYLVKIQYDARQLFVAIEKATVQVRKLELEHASLQVESRAQATPLIIEKLAKEKLQMRSATPAVTQYISNPVTGKTTEAAVEAAK